MRYITYRRFKQKSVCGTQLNLPYGTELITLGDFLMTSTGNLVCCQNSNVCKKYFAFNDDNNGLKRGELIYAIAYSNRHTKNGFRFSADEIAILERDWSHFLKDSDSILFNNDFYRASVEELQELADALHIKVR